MDAVADAIALYVMTPQHLRNIKLLNGTTDDYGKGTIERLHDDVKVSAQQPGRDAKHDESDWSRSFSWH